MIDPVHLVLEKLEDVHPNGNGRWMARCPSHDDDTASLSVGVGEDGRVLLNCFAGCEFEVIVSALGLKTQDLFVPSDKSKAKKPTARWGPVVAHYDYVNKDGSVAYQIERRDATNSDAKTFSARVPKTDGGWVSGMYGTAWILYRLPGLMQSGEDSFIYITEGERDADRVTAEGLVATTNPFGAGKWSKCQSSELDGRHVVVLPDNDATGLKHAESVAGDLHGRAASVRVLLLPVLPKKGDVSDWLDDGHEGEDLWRLAEDCGLWNPPPTSSPQPSNANKPESRLVVTWMSDVEEEEVSWLWANRVPIGKLTIIAGMPGLGKSFVTLDMAARISTGTSWPNEYDQGNTRGTVVLLSAEDGVADTIKPRLRMAGADHRMIVHIDGIREPGRLGVRGFNIGEDIHRLHELVEDVGDVRLVVVDPISAYMGGGVDAHRDNEVRAVLNPLAAFAEQYQVAVVGVMHLRKSASDKALYRVLGSVGFTALARSVWMVAEDPEDESGESRVFINAKLNIAQAAPGLRFSIIEPGRVSWSDRPVTLTADQIFAAQPETRPDEAGPAVALAMDFLRELLRDGPVKATVAKAAATENSIAAAALKRAKARLKVQARMHGFQGGWHWILPNVSSNPEHDD